MFEVWLIMVVVALACSLIGSVLVVQQQAMLADALSHSVLLGIVLGFFISGHLDSPLLLVGATLFGVLAVLSVDFLHSRKIAQDAATGLVFTFFFALSVALISLFARNVHLDVDMVLMGEVLFAPLYRMNILFWSLPAALIKASILLLVNVVFFVMTYRRVALWLFDPVQARLSGLSMSVFKLIVLLLVSLTTVLSFDAVGSMTVIVFLAGPAMTVLPFVKSFRQLLVGGLILTLCQISLGTWVAFTWDLTISGTCSVIALLSFVCASIIRWKT